MKALLIGITTKYDRYDIDYSLDELQNLAESLDFEIVGKINQKLDVPNPAYYVGKGKVQEIILNILSTGAEILIFNDELSPAQLRNIMDETKVEVIDRSYLILKIFELRAQSKESKLEIKLAKDLYLLPRIQFMREKEDRITGGAFNTRGSGETQKELDRRHLMSEINHIKAELEQVKKMKENQIEKRKKNEIPIVALVGYTNAGKSTTMNTLLDYTKENESDEIKDVLSKDQLFSTLFTYNRKIKYNKVNFMLVDTIGFVSKLPHNLVASFYNTLQEIKNADYIIHVVDTSTKYLNQQINVVMDVLNSIGASSIPFMFLLNKWDKTIYPMLETPGYKSIKYSNKTKENIELLMNTIVEEISPSFIHARLLIPYSKGNLVNLIEEKCQIEKKDYEATGTYYEVEIPKNIYNMLYEYDLDTMVS